MNYQRLNNLICPGQNADGSRCEGTLQLNTSIPFNSILEDEINEGIVTCEKCGTDYPIICGVLILVGQIRDYLAKNFSHIVTVAAVEGGEISQGMLGWLTAQGFDLLDLGYQISEWNNAAGMGRYICVHYDDLGSIIAEQLGDQHPLTQFLNKYSGPTLYEILKGLTLQETNSDAWALDVGANVGGLVWYLSHQYQLVWGIDYGFRQALTARKILLHQPLPMKKYRLYHEGLKYTERDIQVTKCPNVEIIVSAGQRIPFDEKQFHLITCANVIDLVPNPNELIQECLRVLRGGGRFLITDPYYWGTNRTPVDSWYQADTGTSAQGLREYLLARKENDIEELEEQDYILWPLRLNARKIDLWLNDVLVAKKRK